MNKGLVVILRLIGSLVAIVFVVLFVGALFSPPITITRDTQQLQALLDKQLPKTFPKWGSDYTVEHATITLGDTIEAAGEGSGHINHPHSHKLITTFKAGFSGGGRVEYRDRAFYFHPDQIKVGELTFGDEMPGARIVRWSEKLRSPALQDIARLAGETLDEHLPDLIQSGARAGFEHFAVYHLKDDAKGWIIGASLQNVEVKNGKLLITFSLRQLTLSALVYLVIGVLALVFTVGLCFCPEMMLPLMLLGSF